MADFQNVRFSKSPILEIFLLKFHRSILVLVELIDVKPINVAQPMWFWGCLTLGQKQPKNTKNAFLACFCPYVRQPHNHIGWASLMGFALINPNFPRTDLWNFREKISKIGDFEKQPFLKIGHFEFFFFKKKFFFASFSWKSVQIRMVD